MLLIVDDAGESDERNGIEGELSMASTDRRKMEVGQGKRFR
jgi:hypothetical protein